MLPGQVQRAGPMRRWRWSALAQPRRLEREKIEGGRRRFFVGKFAGQWIGVAAPWAATRKDGLQLTDDLKEGQIG